MITIVGAGMAGLLAANLLSHNDCEIVEAQPTLPNNHSAVLRFRTANVGTALHIPFKAVQMIKDVLPWRNSVADALSYAYKNGGVYRSDRSIRSGFISETRYIAPDDLLVRMAKRVKTTFGFNWHPPTTRSDRPIISTIPMPNLMQLLNYQQLPEFDYVEGCNIVAKIIDCDAYISLLVPDPNYSFSRISITGDKLIVEFPKHEVLLNVQKLLEDALKLLGLSKHEIIDVIVIPQQYAKIQPIDNDLRKQFIWWATDQYNIYSLGRFACWRPHLLTDDLLHDVQLIDHWLSTRDQYDIKRERKVR